MIKIGLIGDIGSGKSYVAKQFGYPVFNADVEVAKIYRKNRNCFKSLKKKLPKFINSFPIKKNELAKAIINNESNLKKITKVVHPLVRVSLKNFFKKNKNKKAVILDIPLLIENKISKKNYVLVFIDAKKKEINKRLKKRPNFNEKIIKKLKKLQLPLENKKSRSNFVIKNNFKAKLIKKNVRIVKKKIFEDERNST